MKIPPLSLDRFNNALALLAADAAPMPARPFAAPALPPGVVPQGRKAKIAMDDATALYGWLNQAGSGYMGLGFPGYPYLAQLAQRAEYRAPTETIATELTREWIKFTGADEEQAKELEEAFEEFEVRARFREISTHDGFFGRGQLSINIKGQESDKRRMLPLVVDDDGATITQGSLLGFKPVEPMWTTPYAYNSIDPTKPDFYKPEFWYVLGKQTHASRLLTFIGRPVPDMLKPSYNFSGLSLSQLIEPYVVRWLKTVDSVNRLISRFSVSGVMTNMQSALEEGGDASSLVRRAQMFTSLSDNRGLMLLDKDSEEFFQFNTPLSGLSDLQAQAQEHMAAPTHIPLVKLTGISPAGLNASSEGEIKVFYDFIGGEQENLLAPHLMTVLRIIQLHLWGKVDPDIGFEWVPLDSPTDKELSEMRKADSDRATAYIAAGVISPDEERERLRTDPLSGYSGIEGDAPPPPLEQEHELGQQAAEADHARGEESADNAHARAMKEARATAQDAAWQESKHPRDPVGKFGSGGVAEPGITAMAARFVNAEITMVNNIMTAGGLTSKEAYKAFGALKAARAVKREKNGEKWSVTHGAFMERGVLRRAAEVDENAPPDRAEPAEFEPITHHMVSGGPQKSSGILTPQAKW